MGNYTDKRLWKMIDDTADENKRLNAELKMTKDELAEVRQKLAFFLKRIEKTEGTTAEYAWYTFCVYSHDEEDFKFIDNMLKGCDW